MSRNIWNADAEIARLPTAAGAAGVLLEECLGDEHPCRPLLRALAEKERPHG